MSSVLLLDELGNNDWFCYSFLSRPVLEEIRRDVLGKRGTARNDAAYFHSRIIRNQASLFKQQCLNDMKSLNVSLLRSLTLQVPLPRR